MDWYMLRRPACMVQGRDHGALCANHAKIASEHTLQVRLVHGEIEAHFNALPARGGQPA